MESLDLATGNRRRTNHWHPPLRTIADHPANKRGLCATFPQQQRVLRKSRHQACRSQEIENWVGANIRAFEYSRGYGAVISLNQDTLLARCRDPFTKHLEAFTA